MADLLTETPYLPMLLIGLLLALYPEKARAFWMWMNQHSKPGTWRDANCRMLGSGSMLDIIRGFGWLLVLVIIAAFALELMQ